jgi:hypothetical protein
MYITINPLTSLSVARVRANTQQQTNAKSMQIHAQLFLFILPKR